MGRPNLLGPRLGNAPGYGDIREVDPELSGGFEPKPTSFQNSLIFVSINEVFGKIILHVSAPQILN